jgi:hypothetical protein
MLPLLFVQRLLAVFVVAGPLVWAQSASDSVSALCKSMPGMPGCSIDKLCAASSSTLPSPFCSKESVFTDICQDMPSMGDCKAFNSTCLDSTTCKALPSLPSSRTATQQIASICSEMTMDGCSSCKIASPTAGYAECDLLGTYSQLCKAMPEMSQCGAWKALCVSNPSLSYCSTGTAADPPAMKMYFHTGIVLLRFDGGPYLS